MTNAIGSPVTFNVDANVTITQVLPLFYFFYFKNSNFTVRDVSVTIQGSSSIDSGAVLYIIDSTVIFTQTVELYGTIFVAPNSTLVVYPAASISGIYRAVDFP